VGVLQFVLCVVAEFAEVALDLFEAEDLGADRSVVGA
jgi:hypothetical protein